jgi:serine/threonine protein kinase/Flp pilus assembly protein TadD
LFEITLADFTARWERGEAPRVEEYLDRLRPDQRVEMIYREFCLAGWAGLDPRPGDYLARFPAEAGALDRLFGVHDLLGSSRLRLWAGPEPAPPPEVGDEVGPYRLIRDLGRGAFARVFLAEQADLDDRLVVVKVSTRVTPEPALLARASHPHIVEVLWHGLVDDGSLQVICMPFLGGASLAAVLAERRRRGARPGSGRDLLDDLDRASAAGYLPPAVGRPARELVARLSYPGAAAWVVARLAEALDFAYGRGVLHGDVKPSNVLLTADGTPMLLDFNLAVGWRPHPAGPGARGLPGEAGGTLAYMAPERLRTVADPARAAPPTAADRHRADIYSLGVVLLELLTGRAPDLPGGRPLSLQELASAYVSSREHGGEVMIRAARSPLPAGLRSVLARCLAPDPADRYRRASELAEDLDRWRADRPLAFAREPSKALGLLRWARRQRLALAAAATGLAVAGLATAIAWWQSESVRRVRAAQSDEQTYSEESGAFLLRRPGVGVINAQGNPAEVARRNLNRYGVLDPGGGWRQRDEFRKLPPSKRGDLEVWLLEQSLRFAHALSERPDSPGDWQRALISLERVAASSPFSPLRAECRALRRQLGLPEPSPGADDAPRSRASPPRWMEEYLLGVEAELRGDARGAMERYKTVLALRPRSFWANYRGAVVASLLEDYDEAVNRFRECVGQRPDNPDLRRQFASCLYWDGRYEEAAEQCDKAQSLDPDRAETYVTRLFLRIPLKQFQNFVKDDNLYDALTGRDGRGASDAPALDLAHPAPGLLGGQGGASFGRRAPIAPDFDEITVRNGLAFALWGAGRSDLAVGQLDRVLEMNPDDLWARYDRATFRRGLRRADADRDFALVVQHPQVETLIRKLPSAISAFHQTATSLIRQGDAEEAVQTARRGVRLADRHGVMQAESYYVLARAYALAAKTDPALARDALESLGRAYEFSPGHAQSWYLRDPLFTDLRADHGLSPFEFR